MDTQTIAAVALAGTSGATAIAGWAIRSYVESRVSPVRAQLALHEATDEVVHTHVNKSLGEIKATTTNTDAKIDRLIERLL